MSLADYIVAPYLRVFADPVYIGNKVPGDTRVSSRERRFTPGN